MYAGQVEMDRRPGRIGFMSRQRRESCWQFANRMEREGVEGRFCPAPVTRVQCANASSGTARPKTLVPLATNSLQKDHRIVPLVRQDARRGSPPLWTGSHEAYGPPAPLRSCLSLLSVLSGSARLHPTLPYAPAGLSRWAERYDGQGNLHFEHAA
jgi:hypothetical protein